MTEDDLSDRVDPTSIPPPDDSGSTTLSRFIYQAHIAFSFCVDCALGSTVESVIPEHIEDIAVRQKGHWRFIQIKTKDPELGAWRLSDLLSESGGLRSLLRTRRVLGNLECSLELYLEGAVARGDPAEELTKIPSERSPALYGKVAPRLDMSAEECRNFLDRVRVHPRQPPRELVMARNLRILSGYAPGLSAAHLREIHDRVIGAIIQAMTRERLGVVRK